MFGINYNGLRKRESYDDLVNYIETDPNKIRYPNRTATFIERSHYMKHLGGEDYIEMEEQQIRASKEKSGCFWIYLVQLHLAGSVSSQALPVQSEQIDEIPAPAS
jgi:hypothetical protein